MSLEFESMIIYNNLTLKYFILIISVSKDSLQDKFLNNNNDQIEWYDSFRNAVYIKIH